VGVFEIGGDAGNGKNLQPGYEGNAVYNAVRDGEMFTVPQKDGAQPASGNYWNWAMRPGWQKWASKYRYATISGLSGDTCTVTFEACYATDTPDGKQLDVNQVASMGATIEYMSCNGSAFEDGDEVVVELTHTQGVWSSAKVIGFKSEPKGCEWSETWEDGICGQHKWHTDWGECALQAPYITITGDALIVAGITGSAGARCYSNDDEDRQPPIVGTLKVKIPEATAVNYAGIYIMAGGTSIYLKCAGGDWYPYSVQTTFIGFGEEEIEVDLTTCGLNAGDEITLIFIFVSGAGGSPATISVDYLKFTP